MSERPTRREHLRHLVADRVPRLALHLQRVGDVLGRRAVREQLEVLEDAADVAAQQRHLRVLESAEVASPDEDAAVRRLELLQQQPDHRRLPGARRTDDEDELALLDHERDVAKRDDVRVVDLRHRLEHDHRPRTGRRRGRRGRGGGLSECCRGLGQRGFLQRIHEGRGGRSRGSLGKGSRIVAQRPARPGSRASGRSVWPGHPLYADRAPLLDRPERARGHGVHDVATALRGLPVTPEAVPRELDPARLVAPAGERAHDRSVRCRHREQDAGGTREAEDDPMVAAARRHVYRRACAEEAKRRSTRNVRDMLVARPTSSVASAVSVHLPSRTRGPAATTDGNAIGYMPGDRLCVSVNASVPSGAVSLTTVADGRTSLTRRRAYSSTPSPSGETTAGASAR